MSEARQRQRASAVAKLKSAASLPRLPNGRRPPMPPDAATQSDPEDPPGEEDSPNTSTAGHGDANGSPYLREVASEDPTIRMGAQEEDTWTSAQTISRRYADTPTNTELELENQRSCSAPQKPLTPITPVMAPMPTKANCRSRSLSISRDSKDLRKGAKSPTLRSNTDYSRDSSRSRAISPLFSDPFLHQVTSGLSSLEAIQRLYRELTGETSEDGSLDAEEEREFLELLRRIRISGAETPDEAGGWGLDGGILEGEASEDGDLDAEKEQEREFLELLRGIRFLGEPPSADEETPKATPWLNRRKQRRRSKHQGAAAGGNMDNGEPTAIVDDRELLSPTVAPSNLPRNMEFPPQPASPTPYRQVRNTLKINHSTTAFDSTHQESEEELGGDTLEPRLPMASTDSSFPISNGSPKTAAVAPLHSGSASGPPAPPPRSPVRVAPSPSRSPTTTTPSHSPVVTPASRSAAGTPNLATMQPYRGIVMEDEDDTADLAVQFPPHKDGSGPSLNGLGLPRSPLSRPVIQRVPHSSEAPSMAPGHTVPVYLSESASKSPSPTRFGPDAPFPTSPFHAPLKEKESTASRSGRTETEEEDEEPESHFQQSSAVAGSSRGRSPYLEESEKKRELSWVEQPQIPVHYEDDDEEEVEDSWGQEEREEEVDQVYDANDDAQEVPDVTTEAEPEGEHEHETYASPSSHRRSYDSRDAASDMETSPDIGSSYGPPSPSSAVVRMLYNQTETSASNPPSRSASVVSPYDVPVPVRGPGPAPFVLSRSRSSLYSDDESGRADAFISPRGDGSAGPTSAWEKAKNMFRAGWTSGRRSRTNNVGKATVNVSRRESTGNEGLHKRSRSHNPVGVHSLTTSTTYLSSTPQPLHRGPPSPLPGPSPATAARYTHAKLFPLPGLFPREDLRRIDEQRKYGPWSSPSSPDLLVPPSTLCGTVTSETTAGRPQQDNGLRERQIVRQPSNPSLVSLGGYVAPRDGDGSPSPPPSPIKDRAALPNNRKATMEWVWNMRLATSTPSSPSSMSPGLALPEPYLSKRSSLSDILRAREVEIVEWEDSTAERTHTPLSAKVTPMHRTIPLDQPPKGSAPEFHWPTALPPPHVSSGPAQEATDQTQYLNEHAVRTTKGWSQLGLFASMTKQSEIRQGLDDPLAQLYTSHQRSQFKAAVSTLEWQMTQRQIRPRAQEELRTALYRLLESEEEMSGLQRMLPEEQDAFVGKAREICHAPGTSTLQERRDFQEELYVLLGRSRNGTPLIPDLTGVELTQAEPFASGAYNDVYQGLWLQSEIVALSMPRRLNVSLEGQQVRSILTTDWLRRTGCTIQKFKCEVEIWRALQHPNVVRLYGTTCIDNRFYLVSEWQDNGRVSEWIKSDTSVNKVKLLREVATGMEYLHSQKIVHGGFRAASVLIADTGVACISDFGWSEIIDELVHQQGDDDGPSDSESNEKSVRWTAPEVLRGDASPNVSYASDVWSFGMVALEIVNGHQPFDGVKTEHVSMRIATGNLPERPHTLAEFGALSESLWSLIQSCWHMQPEARPSMKELKEMLLKIDRNHFPGVTDITHEVERDGQYPIAHGGFGDVWMGTWRRPSDNMKVAIKILRATEEEVVSDRKLSKRLRRELRIWQRLQHPNVLELCGIVTGYGSRPSFVCPWMDKGCLTKYLANTGSQLRLDERLHLLCDVTDGLAYLHDNNVIHGDLTGANVLLDWHGRARLCDFGLSNVREELRSSTFLTSHVGGAVRWSAPELFEVHDNPSSLASLTMKSDIYSLGCIALETLSGRVPYHYLWNDGQVLIQLSKGIRPRRPSDGYITDDYWQFMEDCWGDLPLARPTAATTRERVKLFWDASRVL